MKKFLCLVIACLVGCAGIWAQDAQKREIERLRKEIASLDEQLKANASKSADATAELAITRQKIQKYKNLTTQTQREINTLNKEISQKKKDINQAQNDLDQALSYYESLVKSAYLSRDTRMRFLYVLSGKSLTQIVRRFAYLRTASDNLKEESIRISEDKARLESEKAALDSMLTSCNKLLAEQNKELNKLRISEKREQQIIKTLQANKSKYQASIKKKKKEIDALNKKIAQIIAEQSKKPKSGAKSSADIKLSKDFEANKGKLPWPVTGTVTGFYGRHNHPVYKKVELPFNNGINISTASGETVCAVFEGTVCQVVVMPGYNQCVLIQHGDYYTFYCKLKDVKVKAGSKVKCGDVLGVVDNIGGETQLHFQLWKGTKSQDPLPWLL